MTSLLQVARRITLDGIPFEEGIYLIAPGKTRQRMPDTSSGLYSAITILMAKPGKISRKKADELLGAHPSTAKEFSSDEPMANLMEWKLQNANKEP